MAIVENLRPKVNGNAHGLDLDLGFLAAANAAGLRIDRLKADGRIHRCPTDTHPKSKNGAYKLSPEEGGGWFKDWASGAKAQAWFIQDGDNSLTEGEKLELKRKRAAARKEADEAQKAAQAIAAEKAAQRWEAAQLADGHQYLEDKGIAAHGARIDGAALLIPVQAADGKMMSLQRILPNGSKFFEQDGAISGGMFVIGEIDPDGAFLLGEGYSTMATCHEATDLPAVVAFNSSNVPKVAKALRAMYPRARICVCADNDHETRDVTGKLTNPGMRDAAAAARLAGTALAVPTVGAGDSDFNDMATTEGIVAVAEIINEALGAVNGKRHKVAAKASNGVKVLRERVAVSDASEMDARGMFDPVAVPSWPARNRSGPFPNDLRNVKAVLRAAGVELKRDLFTGKSVAMFRGEQIEIDDAVCQRFWTMLQNSDLRASLSFTCDAVTALSQENTFDSAVDMFNSLPKWDGVKRAETLLIDELGADNTPYTRGATKLFFATLVRRGMGKESKCDEMVTLYGPQGIGKSTIFKFLIGEEFFQENLKLSHSTREVLELTLGKLIAEMAELSGMKKSDRNDVKTFFSTTHDEFSLKHEKHATRRARRFAFIGTANPEGKIINMLEEDRRFIIVNVTKRADLDRVRRDRLQILAEAVEIEKNYGPRLELIEDLRPDAVAARSAVVAKDEYEEAIREAFDGIVSGKIVVADVYAFLGMRDRTAIGKYTKTARGGITPMMAKMGWEHTQVRRKGIRVLAFIKGNENGWLRAVWPHGPQAPADIGVDEEVSLGWTPTYEDVTPPSDTVTADDEGCSDF